jgi:hypothetical protein
MPEARKARAIPYQFHKLTIVKPECNLAYAL